VVIKMSSIDSPNNDLNKTRPPSGIGGAANEAGSEYRSRVAAWVVSHALAGRRIELLELPIGCDVPTGLILPEGDNPVDDLEVALSNGAKLFIQAKRSLSLSDEEGSEFAKTLKQFSSQVLKSSFDKTNTRLAIAVGKSTKPLQLLQQALSKRRKPVSADLSEEEKVVLAQLFSHITDLTPEKQNQLLAATVILLLDLDKPDSSHREACLAWLSTIVLHTDQEKAWFILESTIRGLSARRIGINIDGWLEALMRGGVRLIEDPAGPAAVLQAMQRYKESVVNRGRQLSLHGLCETMPQFIVEPNTRSINVCAGEDKIKLSWLVRRWQRVLILGLPGVGKSTAMRRLASENAAIKVGPIPVLVLLPSFADRFAQSENKLESLVNICVESFPASDRNIVKKEILFHLRSTGRAMLLLDGLDECRNRRFEVVEAIKEALDELHSDVEVVIATRDSAYAQASTFQFREVKLEPPDDMSSVLKSLAEHLSVKNENFNERKIWIKRVLEEVEKNNKKDPFFQTPLLSIASVVIAAEKGLEVLAKGRATMLSMLVDRIARRWEINKRYGGNLEISAQLVSEESNEFVLAVFNLVGYLLDVNETIAKDQLVSDISEWAIREWGLASGRADAAALAALSFWDEAGIFVASGSKSTVRSRNATFQEIATARWLVSKGNDDVRNSWIDEYLGDKNRNEIFVLLSNLHFPTAKKLVERAINLNDRDLALLVVRALLEGPRNSSDEKHSSLISELITFLMQHITSGNCLAWEVLSFVIKLPLKEEDIQKVLGVVKTNFARNRFEFLEMLLAVCHCQLESLDKNSILKVLAAGPLPSLKAKISAEQTVLSRESILDFIAIDPLYNMLAIELATKVKAPQDEDIARALITEPHMSLGTHLEIIKVLESSGFHSILLEVEKKKKKDFSICAMDWFKESKLVNENLLEMISKFGEPIADYKTKRRMTELVDFLTTALPGDLPAGSIHSPLLNNINLSSSTLKQVLMLGNFNPNILSAQVAVFKEEYSGMIFNFYFDGLVRPLNNWPENEIDRQVKLLDVLGLFKGNIWTAHIASSALYYYPDQETVSNAIVEMLPEIKNYSVRYSAAFAALNAYPLGLKLAHTWLKSPDPVLVRTSALMIGHCFLKFDLPLSELEIPLLKTDVATRTSVQDLLKDHMLSQEALELLNRSRSLPPDEWSCIRCGVKNPPMANSCSSCNIVR